MEMGRKAQYSSQWWEYAGSGSTHLSRPGRKEKRELEARLMAFTDTLSEITQPLNQTSV